MHDHQLPDGTTVSFGVIHVNADGFIRMEVITDGAARLVDCHDQAAVDAVHEIALKLLDVPEGQTTLRGDLLVQLQGENAKLTAQVQEQTTRITALEKALEPPPDVQADTAPAPARA